MKYDNEENCIHCDGSGVCKVKGETSCPDCVEAAGLDMAYYKGVVPCAVCGGKGTVDNNSEKGE